jgi:serine/threonine protein kinase
MGESSATADASTAVKNGPISSGPQADPLIGRVINDRFKVLALIARGGMGRVYRAEQVPLGRLCALKVLHPNYAGEHDPEFHKRFFLEASTSSKLRHPNTVTIFDYGSTDDGIYYMAMELLEGRTLHRVLRDSGPLEPARALRIVRQVCRSLREAHGLGVIHRDLKPANIFLVRNEDEEDFVKVLDFGLVKHLDEGAAEHLTQTGLFMGSPKYMAPEQIQGEKVSAATDVYALGVVLYELLTGKVPFDRGNSVNTLMAHVSEPVPPMIQTNPSVAVPIPIAEFVARCLAKRPEDRFESMDAMLEGLRAAATGALDSISTGEWTRSIVDARAPLGIPEPARVARPELVTPVSDAPPSGPSATPSVEPSEPARSAVRPVALPPAAPAAPVAASGRTGLLVAALAVGGLVAVGVASRMRTSGQAATRTEGGPSASASTGPVAPRADAPADAGAAATSSEPSPVAPTVHIALASEPPNAQVLEDGRELGRTPLELRLTGPQADPSRMHAFTFRLSGYNDAQVTLGGSEIRYVARLARRAATRPTTPTTRPNVPTGYREW